MIHSANYAADIREGRIATNVLVTFFTFISRCTILFSKKIANGRLQSSTSSFSTCLFRQIINFECRQLSLLHAKFISLA